MRKRILIGGILAAKIIVAGVVAGWYYKGNEDRLKAKAAQLAESFKPQPKENLTLYTLSPPSRGVFIEKISTPLSVRENGVAYIVLEEEQAKGIRSGQNVILYDAQNQILNATGQVISSAYGTDSNSDKITADIKVQTAWNVPRETVARGDIIVQREAGAARLPFIALQTDPSDKKEYVWESVRDYDGSHKAYKKPATVTRRNNEMVVIDVPYTSSNVFILNPDKNLQDGQKINAVEVFYSPPSEPSYEIIEATLRTTFPPVAGGAAYDPAEKFGLLNQSYTCSAERAAMAGGAGAGAPASGDAAADFISKIRALSSTLPGKP